MKYSWYKIAAVALALIGVGVTVWNKLHFVDGGSSARKISNNGRQFIANFEGVEYAPYNDGYGKMTIGIGHLIKPGESFGRLTDKEVSELFTKDIAIYEKAVNDSIKVPLTQNQFDALVSFGFNVGPAWITGKHSQGQAEIVKMINRRAPRIEIYAHWVKHFNRSDGQFSQGLQNRRQAEAKLFIS
jgi:lysozyme